MVIAKGGETSSKAKGAESSVKRLRESVDKEQDSFVSKPRRNLREETKSLICLVRVTAPKEYNYEDIQLECKGTK